MYVIKSLICGVDWLIDPFCLKLTQKEKKHATAKLKDSGLLDDLERTAFSPVTGQAMFIYGTPAHPHPSVCIQRGVNPPPPRWAGWCQHSVSVSSPTLADQKILWLSPTSQPLCWQIADDSQSAVAIYSLGPPRLKHHIELTQAKWWWGLGRNVTSRFLDGYLGRGAGLG